MVLLPYRSMETINYRQKETSETGSGKSLIPVIVLIVLILTFISTQLYFMISTLMEP